MPISSGIPAFGRQMQKDIRYETVPLSPEKKTQSKNGLNLKLSGRELASDLRPHHA